MLRVLLCVYTFFHQCSFFSSCCVLFSCLLAKYLPSTELYTHNKRLRKLVLLGLFGSTTHTVLSWNATTFKWMIVFVGNLALFQAKIPVYTDIAKPRRFFLFVGWIEDWLFGHLCWPLIHWSNENFKFSNWIFSFVILTIFFFLCFSLLVDI